MNNIFAIYKPKGPTSHDMIDIIRNITGIKKVGHAGTLDPLASGILVVGVGRAATKKLSQEVAKEKEYIATIKLGEISTTDDEEGDKTTIQDLKISKNIKLQIPNKNQIEEVVRFFVGQIMQIPPIYSALKIKGKPAYKYARAHERIVKARSIEPQNTNDIPIMQSRQVLIKNIDVLEYKWPILRLNVVCGPGVYIRSLARDIGMRLGTGAYLADLTRTRVGKYTKKNIISIEELHKYRCQKNK